MDFENSLKYAEMLDSKDDLSHFREEFHIPSKSGKKAIYFTGNSLGLQPRGVRSSISEELDAWQNLGVDGHFEGRRPWFHYHKFIAGNLSNVVGALPHEVVAMNNLTVNLHLMMVSFYRPDKKRYKIMMEADAFPSDMYAVESQIKFHGFSYQDAVIEISPRKGEYSLRMEDIQEAIQIHSDTLALVLFSGVQYYTGQLFDLAKITDWGHEAGAIVGFDLAHAAGNIPMKLHEWDVDFACWCSYKYLNSGPGGVSGVFVHEKHAERPDYPRFAGWWGHKEEVRFEMSKGFIPEYGAAGWQLSNAPVLSMAAHIASLELFAKAGMQALNDKAVQLNNYLEYILLKAIESNPLLELKIITPPFPERGCQISLLTGSEGKKLFEFLEKEGVVADWRHPNVIRIAPVPLYNSFSDVYNFGKLLSEFR